MGERIEQSEFWDERAQAWAGNADDLETFAAQFSDPAIDRLDLRPGQHVADIGCGPGVTTAELARRVAPDGTATGIDVSPGMVSAATARAEAHGADNLRFVLGDPGEGALGPFDAVFSRFGVMFFDDPGTAFANLCRSIRPGGRFVAVAWAALNANPWMYLTNMFAAGPLEAELTPPAPDEPGPFSLADPAKTTTLLESSGFVDVSVDQHGGAWTAPVASAEDAIGRLLAVGPMGGAWASAGDDARKAAVDAVAGAFDDHRDGDTWRVPAAALVIAATAPA